MKPCWKPSEESGSAPWLQQTCKQRLPNDLELPSRRAFPNTSSAQTRECPLCPLQTSSQRAEIAVCSVQALLATPPAAWKGVAKFISSMQPELESKVQREGFSDRSPGASPRQKRLFFFFLGRYTMPSRPSDLWSLFPRIPRGSSKKTPCF